MNGKIAIGFKKENTEIRHCVAVSFNTKIKCFHFATDVAQESRRILIAVWQNIVFEEYLQIILGPTAHRRYQIARGTGGGQIYSKCHLYCLFSLNLY